MIRSRISSHILFVFVCLITTHTYASSTLDGVKILSVSKSGLTISVTPKLQVLKPSEKEPTTVPSFTNGYDLAGISQLKSAIGIVIPLVVPNREVKITKVNTTFYPEQFTIDPKTSNVLSSQKEMELPLLSSLEEVDLLYAGVARFCEVANLLVPFTKIEGQKCKVAKEIIVNVEFANTGISTFNPENIDSRYINSIQYQMWNKPIAMNKVATVTKEILSNGNWAKATIVSEGIYKFTKEQLSNAGIDVSKSMLSTLKVLSFGGEELPVNQADTMFQYFNEIPIHVVTDNNGDLRHVLVYCSGIRGFKVMRGLVKHYTNTYTNSYNIYVTSGGSDGRRLNLTDVSNVTPDFKPAFVRRSILIEDEISNVFANGSGKRWLGQIVDPTLPRTITTVLPGLFRGEKSNVDYRICLGHRSDSQGGFSITENGSVVGTMTLFGTTQYVDAVTNSRWYSLSTDSISSDNRSMLRFSYSNNLRPSASGLIDFIEIHYPAQLSAIDGALDFSTDGIKGLYEYSINGFGSENIALDITDKYNPFALKNSSTTQGIVLVRTYVDSAKPRQLFIASNFSSATLSKVELKELREDKSGATVIVIAPNTFKSSAQAFVDFRKATTKESFKLVESDAIYDQFAGGSKDPSAIRNFLAFALNNWVVKPKYVVLWGDGHFDFRKISTTQENYIPTAQITYANYLDENDEAQSHNAIDSYASEDYLISVNNDKGGNLTDFMLGRIPLNSNEEGFNYINKIKSYLHAPSDSWRSTVLMVADDGPTSNGQTDGSLHTGQSEALSGYVDKGMQVRKVYMAEYPTENVPKGRRKPRVTDDLLSVINNQGALIVNWIGHGNPRVWAHETVFDRDVTVPQFTNQNKLFFLTAATCDFARFDLPGVSSGAEELFFLPTGGTIGCLSASRVVYSHENSEMIKVFYTEMFKRSKSGSYRTIGEMLFDMKQVRNSQNDQKYFLLGDPTLSLNVPNFKVKFDAINEKILDSVEYVNVPALSTIKIEGSILDCATNELASKYTGNTVLTLYDSDVYLAINEQGTIHNFTKYGGALHKGVYEVVNGKFVATFVVPKDISFSNAKGRLFGFATSTDSIYAMGESDKIRIAGVTEVEITDNDGPSMQIFVDAKTFKPYDVVRSNPLIIVDLKDETGINTTGIGIGHKIEAWIDDNIESVDLTDNFMTSLTNSKVGTAKKQVFGLSKGLHSVRARAWDVVNNFTEATTFFNVGDNDSIVIVGRVEVYPNPFSTKTNIIFTHNQSISFTTKLQIFTINGVMVKSFDSIQNNLQAGNFEWDGKDQEGNSMPDGTYPFVISLSSPSGEVQSARGFITYLR